MQIVGKYSFNRGAEVVAEKYPGLLLEIEEVIASVDARACRIKESKEKTMPGRILYSPPAMNTQFDTGFTKRGWSKHREKCQYPTQYYLPGYKPPPRLDQGAFREMDFVKKKLGVEVQFGKYAFMVYNVAAKMTIFHNLRIIDTGVEIVPVKNLASEMSTGVSYFEQFVWDLEHRGVADIDIPVLILGIDADREPTTNTAVSDQLDLPTQK